MDISLVNHPSYNARHGSAAWLGEALAATRGRTLGMVDAWRRQLGDALAVPYGPTLNPPRWELGHIGWFEAWWVARNSQRELGCEANPHVARRPSAQAHGDHWYNSSLVEHTSRWKLDLPPIEGILDEVAQQREKTLALLQAVDQDSDAALYFFRLSLLHEDMHGEAWAMMAQQLGIAPGDELSLRDPAPVKASTALHVPAMSIDLASEPQGFIFDNEGGSSPQRLEAFSLDAAPVTWGQYLPFVERGGYSDRGFWSDAGWAWLESLPQRQPRYLRQSKDGAWQRQRFDAWLEVDASHPASHLTQHEAQAWCRWAQRRLPTEAQWCAAQRHDSSFAWGDVWEWTSSTFMPFKGFKAHPYRDYSQPWFGERAVLKGASLLTHPHIKHHAYRNFFTPDRNDVMAGFRSCAA